MSISQDSVPRSGASLAASIAAAGLAIPDDKFSITGSSDATKTIKFEADAQTAGADLTIDSGAQTVDRTLSVPVLAGAANIVVREAALTDNAVIRADSTLGKIQNSAVIIDDSNNVTGVVALTIGGALAGVTTIANSGIQTNSNATDATTISNGSSTHAGGVSITKALWVGGLSNIAGVATFQDNIVQSGAKTLSTGTGTNTLNGNVVVTTGKTITAVSGIIFSNETLSQYDEGTWTPTIVGDSVAGVQTYSAQVGYYTRIGRFVHCAFYVNLTAKGGTMAGNAVIGGLPFTVTSSSSYVSGSAIGGYEQVTLGAGYTQLCLRQAVNGTTALLGKAGTAVAFAAIVAADIANTTFISGTITYEI